MNFQQALANYALGNVSHSKIPEIGINGLKEGLDSESLIILAGLSERDNSFEILHYFDKALQELNVKMPEKEDAVFVLMAYYLDAVLDGEIDPVEGVGKIYNDILLQTELFYESKFYVYDSINFHHIYGLYDSYLDLKEAKVPWRDGKTNEELMQDIKFKIIQELKIWKIMYELK